jgi:hypothetical protein
LLESALFDAREECGKLASGCQGGPSVVWREMLAKGPSLAVARGLTAPHQAFILQSFSGI